MIEPLIYWFITLPSRAKAGAIGGALVVLITLCLALLALFQGGVRRPEVILAPNATATRPSITNTATIPATVPTLASTATALATVPTLAPNATSAVPPTVTGLVLAPSATVAIMPSATASMLPSATAPAFPSATAAVLPSATSPALPSAVVIDVPATEQAYNDQQATITAIAAATNTAPPAATATAIPLVPTVTPLPPTETPSLPTVTPLPPTNTVVPPTATRVPPTATRVPPTAGTIEEQISALAFSAAQSAGREGQCRIDRDRLPSGRYSLDMTCTVALGGNVSIARQIAFDVHRALWTSNLPVGALRVRVSAPGSNTPIVDASAGYIIMRGQSWQDVTVTTWISFLRANERRTNDPERSAWYVEG